MTTSLHTSISPEDFHKERTENSEKYPICDEDFIPGTCKEHYMTLKEDLILVRLTDGTIKSLSGGYFTFPHDMNKLPTMREVMNEYALLKVWGDKTHVSVVKIPAGTFLTLKAGLALPQNSGGEQRPGGGFQVRLLNNIELDWIQTWKDLPDPQFKNPVEKVKLLLYSNDQNKREGQIQEQATTRDLLKGRINDVEQLQKEQGFIIRFQEGLGEDSQFEIYRNPNFLTNLKKSQRDINAQIHRISKNEFGNNLVKDPQSRFISLAQREKNPFVGTNPAKKDFQQKLQKTKLTETYNNSHSNNPVPAKGSTGGQIGGVACSTDYLKGLFDSPHSLFSHTHAFYLPNHFSEEIPFSNQQLKQILRELAIGVYVHSTVPFFSLHFNQKSDQFPIIHPAYANTLVGRVIGMLDYFMKGYLNGGTFSEKFINEWHKNPNWSHKSKNPLDQLIDFKKYCEEHFQGNDKEYFSYREYQQKISDPDLPETERKKFQNWIDDIFCNSSPEDEILKDYKGFQQTFRIIAKQQSLQKEGDLILIDSDFDVLWTLIPTQQYTEALEDHLRRNKKIPASNLSITIASEEISQKVHDHMVKFPLFRHYFAMLAVINFFSSYFSTLKKHRKVPLLFPQPVDLSQRCPPLFPHLPIRKYNKQKIDLNPKDFIKEVYKELFPDLSNYIIQLFALKKNGGDEKSVNNSKEKFGDTLKKLLGNYLKKDLTIRLQRFIKDDTKNKIDDLFAELSLKIIDAIHKNLDKVVSLFAKNAIEAEQAYSNKEKFIKDFVSQFGFNSENLSEEIGKILSAIQDKIKVYDDLKNYSFDSANKKLFVLLKKHFVDIEKQILIAGLKQEKPDISNNEINGLIELIFDNQKFNIFGKSIAFPDEFLKPFKEIEGKASKFSTLILKAFEEDIRVHLSVIKGEPLREYLEDSKFLTEIFSDKKLNIVNLAPSLTSLISEVPQNEKEIDDKIVGGCGLRLRELKVQSSDKLKKILKDHWPVWKKGVHPLESWYSVKGNLKIEKGGHLFSLPFEDLPAQEEGDYTWMESLFIIPQQVMKEKKETCAEIASTIFKGEQESFTDLIKRNSNFNEFKDQHDRTLLHYAALQQIPFFVETLLKYGALSSSDNNGFFPIHYAAMTGSSSSLKIFAQLKPGEINTKSTNGLTPLTVAIQHKQKEAVKVLISLKAEISMAVDGYTDLHAALHEGDLETINDLLDYPPSHAIINEATEESGTPLLLACELDSSPLIKKMIHLKADVKIKRRDGISSIDIAIMRGCGAILEILLKYDDPSSQALETLAKEGSEELIKIMMKEKKEQFFTHTNSGKDTLLHTAIRSGNLIGAACMIKECQDPAYLIRKNLEGDSPFSLLCSWGLWNLVKLCLDKKAYDRDELFQAFKNLLNHEYNEVLDIFFNKAQFDPQQEEMLLEYAAQVGNHQAITRTLKSSKADLIKLIGPKDWKIQHYLAKCNALFLFRQTIGQDFLMRLEADEGRTLPYIAAENSSFPIFQFLLSKMEEQKSSLENHFKGRHLFYAVIQSGNLDSFNLIHKKYKELCQMQMDPVTGELPTHLVVRFGHLPILKLLSEAGADLNAEDKNGFSPLCYAIQLSDTELINYLFSQKVKITPLALYLCAKKDIPHGEMTDQISLNQALFHSVQKQDYPTFVKLYRQGAKAVSENDQKQNSFLLACSTGQFRIVKFLIEEKLLVSELTNNEGSNGLHLAANGGHYSCVKLLIEAQFDQTKKNGEGKTALEIAGNHQGIRSLLLDDEAGREYKTQIAQINSLLKEMKFPEAKELLKTMPQNEIIEIEYASTIYRNTPLQLLIVFNLVDDNELKEMLAKPGLNLEIEDTDGNRLIHYLAKNNYSLPQSIPFDIRAKTRQGETIIHLAASHASEEYLKNILIATRGSDLINKRNSKGRTPIYDAITARKEKNVKILAEEPGIDLSIQDDQLITPLQTSLNQYSFAPSLLNHLLDRGADPNQKGRMNKTPLESSFELDKPHAAIELLRKGSKVTQSTSLLSDAAEMGWIDLIYLLVAMGVSPLKFNNNGSLPIHRAAWCERLDVIKALLKINHTMINGTNLQGVTPLHIACRIGNKEMAEFLMKNGADAEALTHDELTPFALASMGNNATQELFYSLKTSLEPKNLLSALNIAIEQDNLDILKRLYARGVHVGAVLNETGSGLHNACRVGALLCTQWLLSNGADPYQKNRAGYDTFEISATNNSYEQFKLLLEFAKSNLDEIKSSGMALIHHATKAGKLNHVTLLISLGASINKTDNKLRSPLCYAANQGHLDIFELLLFCGAEGDLNELLPDEYNQEKHSLIRNSITQFKTLKASAKKGEKALHLAVRGQHLLAVQLLSNGYDHYEERNEEGETALHLTAQLGFIDVMMILLSEGADIESRDDSGKTPLEHASLNDYDSTVFLLRAGAKMSNKIFQGMKEPWKEQIELFTKENLVQGT